MEQDKRLYYIICVQKFSYSCSRLYRLIVDYDFETYIDAHANHRIRQIKTPIHLQKEGDASPRCSYQKSYYKFDTYEDAKNKAIELVEQGILPNLPFSDVVKYGNTSGVISIIQRPLGDIIGYRYAEYLEKNKDNKDIEQPQFIKGDVVYLTNIEDGKIIYKTKVVDCCFENGKWYYYTTYWSDYGYTNVKSEKQFMEHCKMLGGNKCEYFWGPRYIEER